MFDWLQFLYLPIYGGSHKFLLSQEKLIIFWNFPYLCIFTAYLFFFSAAYFIIIFKIFIC